MKRPFELQEGEKVIKEIEPLPALKKQFFAVWFFILLVTLTLVYVLTLAAFTFSILLGMILLVMVLAIHIGLSKALSGAQYSKQYYWITNKRVVYKRGILGYQITSVPYERISDIIISRTFFEKVFGFGSLHVQSLAGQFSTASMLGSEAALLAIPEPEKTQELIFKLAKAKRKKEKLTF